MNPTVEQTDILGDEQLAEIQQRLEQDYPSADYDVEWISAPLCSHCNGAVDDHRNDCVAPQIHALLAHAAALQAQVNASNRAYENSKNDLETQLRMERSGRDELRARLAEVEQERHEGLSLDKVAAVAVEAFRRQAIEAVRALSDNQLNRTAICARLELLSTEGREGNG